MKKILSVLFMMLMCVMVNAQDLTYSQELVDKAEGGDDNAMTYLGYCYKHGLGISKDLAKAHNWYKKAADKGNIDAMYNLAGNYRSGEGTSKDFSKSFYWYQKAAEKGHAVSMFFLSIIYEEGKWVPRDSKKAEYWYKKAEENGDAESLSHIGFRYQTGMFAPKDNVKAAYWYNKAAEKGDVLAMFSLGFFYSFGEGVSKDDSKAFYWYKKAAEKGHYYSMYNLGSCYKDGKGVTKDVSQAVYWYKKAAENGDDRAMESLSSCYENGEGVKRNKSKADILFSASKKAKAGDTEEAMKLLYQVFPDMAKPKIDPKNPPIIQIVPGSIMFADATGNNAIDAKETCSVSFKVKNIGKGSGYDCVAEVKTSAKGISCGEKKIKEIKAGETIEVTVPVTSSINTKDGTADLAVSVEEPNGLGCDPTVLSVNTKAYVEPMLKIVDYAASSESGDKLKRMQPFTLQMIMQNTKYGNAENVDVDITIPDGVLLVDGEASRSFTSIAGGGKKEITIGLMAKNIYKSETIPVKVTIREKYGKYAESKTISLAMNQQMSAQRIVVDENETTPLGNIEIAQIDGKIKLSDVDQDIPHNAPVNKNTFAVIIANENYLQESKVTYALNDGKMFGTYCREVLGLPKENVRVIGDATLNQMRGGINWLKKVADAYKGEASLIFYYAGHGVPDESTREAYLLPVDGYGNDLVTAYKMDDLYNRLSSCPGRQTLVFLDACFSGKQRSGEDMATARAVGITTRKAAPKGNMVVFSAAQGDETAYPYEEKQHGMFTYYLLKKLQLTKGDVTLGDLGSYIRDNVLRKSVVTNTKSQTPVVQPSHAVGKDWKSMKLF